MLRDYIKLVLHVAVVRRDQAELVFHLVALMRYSAVIRNGSVSSLSAGVPRYVDSYCVPSSDQRTRTRATGEVARFV